jgi:hypothetical protein
MVGITWGKEETKKNEKGRISAKDWRENPKSITNQGQKRPKGRFGGRFFWGSNTHF